MIGEYLIAVEDYFSWKRDTTGWLFSVLDWQEAVCYFKAGIPLYIVCEGIDKTFEKIRWPHKVNSLRVCTNEIIRKNQKRPHD